MNGLSSNGTQRPRSTGGGDTQRRFEESVCAFWLGEHCYGISCTLVSEVFAVESVASVPSVPAEVLGLFNLRGTPVALVDLARVLELPDGGKERSGAAVALVLRTSSLVVGALIRKMEMVVPSGRGLYSAPEGSGLEHPLVAGFLELPDRPELTVTLLEPEALVARLNRLRFLQVDPELS